MNPENQEPPNQWQTPLLERRNTSNKGRRCGFCGFTGHNKRTCPRLNQQDTTNTLPATTNVETPLERRTIFESNNSISNDIADGTENLELVTQPDEFPTNQENDDSSNKNTDNSDDSVTPDRSLLPKTMYVVFDLETTGFIKERHTVIEIAGQILDPLGNIYGESYESYVNPLCRLPIYIKNLTGIKDKDLVGKPTFQIVATDFLKFILNNIRQYEEENQIEIERIVFVAHNGIRFDIPFFFFKLEQARIKLPNNMQDKIFTIDTLVLAAQVVKKLNLAVPEKYTLQKLYYYCTGEQMQNAHRALVDVNNYDRHFIPGQQLSLDESLVRAFGRIRFKVRIITKAARYGMKLYVLTDAETSFVLRVIIYTGKSTYDEKYGDMKKTVQVVRRLVEDYSGTYRTIYVDRFYTSMDLVKELDNMDLFVTGTIMTNKIPKEFEVKPSSAEFKNMERGDHKFHNYTYFDNNNQPRESGLVAWKDTNMVYMLTNNCNTVEASNCTRNTKYGDISIRRPNVISEYNKFMGGVDLADMKRLHCNSTVMCQNRWWLKLFFYNLDVATANAMVLYQLATNDTQMNVADFKLKLISHFMMNRTEKIKSLTNNESDEHKLVRLPDEQRFRCAYCALFAKKGERCSRTRFICAHSCCGIPLCAVGSSDSQRDCFSLCHGNKDLLKLAKMKHDDRSKSITIANQKKNNKNNKTATIRKRPRRN